MLTIALFGAAGKIGTRLSDKLKDDAEFRMLYVEASETAESHLRALGLEPSSQEEAASEADVVILAVPDVLIGPVARDIVPSLKSGTMLICLDAAGPFGGELPDREDITYFVTHPCHPPIFGDEVVPEARSDFFGGIANQNIVCALMRGPESDYAKGERICRKMFAPVMNAHRLTVAQMALLEPILTETVALSCMTVVREALDHSIELGVPADAAKDFLFGHLNVTLGALLGFADIELSDGAKLAAERGKTALFRENWERVFRPENVMNEVRAILRGAQAQP